MLEVAKGDHDKIAGAMIATPLIDRSQILHEPGNFRGLDALSHHQFGELESRNPTIPESFGPHLPHQIPVILARGKHFGDSEDDEGGHHEDGQGNG